jgi:hypothetical protein
MKNLFYQLLPYSIVSRLLRGKITLITNQKFSYDNCELNYYVHSYNNMFHFNLSERSIEVPIIKHYLDKISPQNTLEIGNVTKHYYEVLKNCFVVKDTLDKYEKAFDVINEDIANYRSKFKYDFIYSISTFEHMDSDGGRNPESNLGIINEPYSSVAATNIHHVVSNLLTQNGKFIITFPLGYLNSEIDKSILNGELLKLPVQKIELKILKRFGKHKWKLISETIDQIKYPFPKTKSRNYLGVIEITK